jgi:hypothetical protein
MIAYNNEWLKNLIIRKDIAEAFDENCITKSEQDVINEKHNTAFYTPNIFIRIGLFILTVIILLFSFGLLMLLFLDSMEKMIGALSVFYGIILYVFLEYIVKSKKHYRSGVDDALLYCSVFAIFAGISLPNDQPGLVNCFIIFFLSLYGSLRFTDRLMAVVLYISLLGILFYSVIELGNTGKAAVPFIIMAASALIYFITGKLRSGEQMLHYEGCLQMILIISLISMYVAGNYFVVHELSDSIFHMNLQPGESIPFGWLFWIFTVIIPFIYLIRGIQSKDVILLRVGLLLIAAMVFTIRYYHTIMPVELVMALGGIILILIGYGMMKYLHEPKFGFTYKDISKKNTLGKLNIESLVLAETFAPGIETEGTKFGGGDFGGGGASGEF